MLHHDQADGLIIEERQEPGASVIDAGPHLFDHLRHLIALRCSARGKALGLALEVACVLCGGHLRVDRDTLRATARRRRFRLNENGPRVHLAARQFPRLPPTPGSAIADALLLRIVFELHSPSISHMTADVHYCPFVLAALMIPAAS